MDNLSINVMHEFTATMNKFLDHRRKYGGILLPDKVILDQAYHLALLETKVVEPEKEIHIIGKK